MTLIELCFGLALVALIAGLAAPGFKVSLRAAAVRAATFEVLAGLQRARSSAILESRVGVLCPSNVSGGCAGASTPSSAWTTFLEVNGSTVPLATQHLPAGVVLSATRSPLRFWPDALAASTGTLTICDSLGIAPPRAIVVSQSGRARVTDAPRTGCS